VIDPVTIERLADAAWPAAERERLGPWTLRATAGVTRRANSAFTAVRADVPSTVILRYSGGSGCERRFLSFAARSFGR
jgi:hypothetical protein